jgi:O-antigen/teichoic acid export membrane protein
VAGITVLQGIILTRSLGLGGYGSWALVTGYVLAISQLFDFRTWETLIRYVPLFKSRSQPDAAVGVVWYCCLLEVVSGTLAWLFVVGTAKLAATYLLKDVEAFSLFRLFALIALLNIPFEPATALLRLANRFSWQTFYRVTVAGVRLLATLLMWYLGATVERMLVAQLLGTIVGLPLLLVFGGRAFRLIGTSPVLVEAFLALKGHLRSISKFVVLSSLTGTSRMISERADTLILGLFAAPQAVGAYQLARTIVAQLISLGNPIYSAVFPEISKLFAAGMLREMTALLRRLSLVLCGVGLTVAAAGITFSPWLIPIIFGRAFEPSVIIFQILVWRILWLPLVWYPGAMLAIGRAGTVTGLSWFHAAVLLVCLVAFVPLYGGIGAAVASTTAQFLWIMGAVGSLMRLSSSTKQGQDVRE